MVKTNYVLRQVRHDVIFELYPNEPTILNLDPTICDPSGDKSEPKSTDDDFIKESDQQLGEPVRNPIAIFTKLRKKISSRPNRRSSRPNQPFNQVPQVYGRNEVSTQRYIQYRSTILVNQYRQVK